MGGKARDIKLYEINRYFSELEITYCSHKMLLLTITAIKSNIFLIQVKKKLLKNICKILLPICKLPFLLKNLGLVRDLKIFTLNAR